MTAPHFEPDEIEKAVPLEDHERRIVSEFHVLMILARTGLRRFANAYFAKFTHPVSSGSSTSSRRPTSRRRSISLRLLSGIVVLFFFSVYALLITKMTADVSWLAQQSVSGRILLQPEVHRAVHKCYDEMHHLHDRRTANEISQAGFEEEKGKLLQRVDSLLRNSGLPSDPGDWTELQRANFARAMDAFKNLKSDGLWESTSWAYRGSEVFVAWAPPFDRLAAKAMSLFLLMGFVACLLTSLASVNKDVGGLGWIYEWLFTMPISPRSLMLARVFEAGFLNTFAYLYMLQVIVISLWFAGWSWLSIPVGIAMLILLNAFLGSLCVLSETYLRMHLSPAKLRNLNALIALSGVLVTMVAYASPIAAPIAQLAVSCAGLLPDIVLALPTGLPILLGVQAVSPYLTIGAAIATICCLSYLCVSQAAQLVSGGYVAATGLYQGSRLPQKPIAGVGFLRGAAWKEKTLLLRDRALLVTAIGLPAVMIGYNLLIGAAALSKLTDDFARMAALAFGVGSFSLLFGAANVLALEARTMWLVFSFPSSLRAFFFRKAAFWAVLSCLFTALVLTTGVLLSPTSDVLRTVALSFFALSGVVVLALVAVGFSLIATNFDPSSPAKNAHNDLGFIFMMLLAEYGGSFFLPNMSGTLILLVLLIILVYALWQKSSDTLPYLLDPTELPPPALYLTDGILAVIAFFFLQALLQMLFALFGTGAAASIVLGYAMAGLIVSSVTLFILVRRRIPGFWTVIGLPSLAPREPLHKPGSLFGKQLVISRPCHREAVVNALGTGMVSGILAATVAGVYLFTVNCIPVCRDGIHEYLEQAGTRGIDSAWFAVLAVLLAPIVEEFLFRGLLFKGFLKTMSLPVAVAASAAVFAMVHPPVSMIPVFGLGCAAALAFHRTGLLMAPIVAHFTYNGLIVLFSNLLV
ncbi:MAG: CPBP family intramembrane glutamic endopeptidase [Candidatus Brocadiia bacterium]